MVKVRTFLLLSIALAQNLNGQSAGSPITTGSHRQLTVSVEGGYFRKEIFSIQNDSPRILLKPTYGFGRRLDIFALVGVTKLSLDITGEEPKVLRDKYRLAFGGGVNLLLLKYDKWRFSGWLSGQFLRFKSRPSTKNILNIAEATVEEVLEFKYDWRETNINGGIAKEIGQFRLYAGVNLKNIRRLESRLESVVFNSQAVSVDQSEGEYQSGFLISPIIGLDVSLPSRMKISLEMAGNSRADFALYVGLSQTGRP